MKLYKIKMITYYEIEAENLDEAFDKMTNENISDSWVDCYEEEEIEKMDKQSTKRKASPLKGRYAWWCNCQPTHQNTERGKENGT